MRRYLVFTLILLPLFSCAVQLKITGKLKSYPSTLYTRDENSFYEILNKKLVIRFFIGNELFASDSTFCFIDEKGNFEANKYLESTQIFIRIEIEREGFQPTSVLQRIHDKEMNNLKINLGEINLNEIKKVKIVDIRLGTNEAFAKHVFYLKFDNPFEYDKLYSFIEINGKEVTYTGVDCMLPEDDEPLININKKVKIVQRFKDSTVFSGTYSESFPNDGHANEFPVSLSCGLNECGDYYYFHLRINGGVTIKPGISTLRFYLPNEFSNESAIKDKTYILPLSRNGFNPYFLDNYHQIEFQFNTANSIAPTEEYGFVFGKKYNFKKTNATKVQKP